MKYYLRPLIRDYLPDSLSVSYVKVNDLYLFFEFSEPVQAAAG